MSSKVKRHKDCIGCDIISSCDFPISLKGRRCPCANCIVKTMCPKVTTCEEYLSYEKFLISELGESFREE